MNFVSPSHGDLEKVRQIRKELERRGQGLPELICDGIKANALKQPIPYNLFISYSLRDSKFATRLSDDCAVRLSGFGTTWSKFKPTRIGDKQPGKAFQTRR